MFGLGMAHGKFGELLQGALPGEDANFLVSFPILNHSITKFYCYESDKSLMDYPASKEKSASLTKKIMDYFKLDCGWKLIVESNLDVGKGLGSSTADMVAVTRAITTATGRSLPIEILLKFLKEIEPSDGLMYEGVVCFYHRKVALHSQLGYLFDLMIVGVDEGGVVDTIKFNQRLVSYTAKEKSEFQQLLSEINASIKKRELAKLGVISTRSAVIHQAIQPKENLSFFIDLCATVGALGVIVAHSGTYLGLILDKKAPDFLKKLAFIEKKLKEKSLQPKKFMSLEKNSIRSENVC